MSERSFKSRFVLIDRESVLGEVEPLEFAEKNGCRILLEDNVCVNAAMIRFSVAVRYENAKAQRLPA